MPHACSKFTQLPCRGCWLERRQKGEHPSAAGRKCSGALSAEGSECNPQSSEAYKPVTKRTQILLLTILAVPMAFGSALARAGGQALVWGKAVDGFQMALSFESARHLPSGAPALRLHFRNTGIAGGDMQMILESDIPKLYYSSDTLTLLVKDSSGRSERLADIKLYSGRRCNFEIPMPLGAAYSMPLNFDYYRALTESGTAKDFESPGSAKGAYAFEAVMTVDLGEQLLLTVTSNDLVAGGSKPFGTNQAEPDWGAAVNDFQMALSLGPAADAASRLPAIRLWLRNVGATDFHVVLGGGCGGAVRGGSANGANGWNGVNGVTLNLTDSSGHAKQLNNVGPGPPYQGGCAGGGWIFDVPMTAGAAYSVPLALEYYKTSTYSRITRDFERGWEPGGTYTLQAVLKLGPQFGIPPGEFLGSPWAGTITSRGLEVHFPTQ
jgi:hypothetical protein